LGNGTIDWSAAEQTVVANHSLNLFVSVDSGGHPWVEVADYTYKSSTTDGTWVEDTANGFPYYDAYISPGGRSIIPLLNGKMLVYAQVTLGPGEARAWSGTSWGSRILTSFDTNGFYNYSAVGQGDTVEFASTRKAGLIYTAVHFVYTYSTNTFSSPLTIRTIEDGASVIMGISVLGTAFYCYVPYVAYPSATSYIYLYERWGGVWQSVETLVYDTAGITMTSVIIDYEPSIGHVVVYYMTITHVLKAAGIYVETGKPVGLALDADSVTSTSAHLRGEVVWDGNSDGNCTALFTYGGAGQEETIDYEGFVVTGNVIEVSATGLIPNNWYVYWMVLTNEYGDHWSNLIHFQTLEGTTPTVPIVETNAATLVTDVSARLNGHLLYDGDTPGCAVGFQYRVEGTGTWSIGWNSVRSGYWHTDETFAGDLTSLVNNTTYEFRAIAKNGLSDPDNPQYGATMEFTTGYAVVPTPAGEGGGIIPPGLIPPWLSQFFRNLSSGMKLMLGIIINVGAVIAVAFLLGKSKAVGVAAITTGFGLTILFVSIGWYPKWIIFLIGAIVGLLVLLIISGNRK
jgi:hypothetical protein